jgi:hypothetical protein
MAAYVAFATRPSPGARLHQVRWSDRGRRLLRARRRRRAEARRRREHRRIQDLRAAEAGYRAFAEQLRATADHIFAVHLGSPGDTDGLTARPVGAGQNGAMR